MDEYELALTGEIKKINSQWLDPRNIRSAISVLTWALETYQLYKKEN